MKIIVSEDDRVSRTLLSTLLSQEGHRVYETENGKQAWKLWQKKQYPIIISDWLMPVFDGLELCKKIRSTGNSNYTYFIMVTVLEGKEKYLQAIAAGVDDFLSKPFDRDQLMARLHVAARILNLQNELKTISGLLPVCAYCKKVRDDHNYWERVENYIERNSKIQISHGICPECYETVTKRQLKTLRRKDIAK
jgi:sigma-B regulation protein RsbU (phosphoserine phosphatase)